MAALIGVGWKLSFFCQIFGISSQIFGFEWKFSFFSLSKKPLKSGTKKVEDKFCRQEMFVRTRPAARLQSGRAARPGVRWARCLLRGHFFDCTRDIHSKYWASRWLLENKTQAMKDCEQFQWNSETLTCTYFSVSIIYLPPSQDMHSNPSTLHKSNQ